MQHSLALTGDPIGHSLSPAMHRAAFRASGLKGSYELRPGGPKAFAAAVEELRAGELTGINVTMPHKRRAMDVCDRLTDLAQRAGSVNTLKVRSGEIYGHSSDAAAFSGLLSSGALRRSRIVILGSGGSAASALAAIASIGADFDVVIQSRQASTANELLERTGVDARVDVWGSPLQESVLINATPLGMAPGEELPEGMVGSSAGLIDLPYAAGRTHAVELATSLGIPVVDGLKFLSLQGAESFLWWTGTRVDPSVMEEAARNG